ncbi:uncharacterized protein [Apostichopus japonicus]|uniref:uncharacterized protein isoform X2 n=1 Tax=Stichopus japonicus TaxID=307972 RepID=UPI003AB495B0
MSDPEIKRPTLLALAHAAKETPAQDEPDRENDSGLSCGSCCRSCCRLLVCLLCMPFLIVLSLVGLLLKIILCPFKACSPCCAPCCQCLVDGAEAILKAPFKLFLWATYRLTEDEDGEQQPLHVEEG